MEILQLERKITGSKKNRFLYLVYQNGEVIAQRHSNRDYLACFVTRSDVGYDCPYFFSRVDLIGRGGSSSCHPCALAILDSHRPYACSALSKLTAKSSGHE